MGRITVGIIIPGEGYTSDPEKIETYNRSKQIETSLLNKNHQIAMHKITKRMGLRFGQEEEYPDIKHHSSEQKPIYIKPEDI